jgi:hypothetical protein
MEAASNPIAGTRTVKRIMALKRAVLWSNHSELISTWFREVKIEEIRKL